jgi:hypothetical protein
MGRVGSAAGVIFRANSSLAGVVRLLGLARGGNGSGLRVPLSCALAIPCTKIRTANNPAAAGCLKPHQTEHLDFPNVRRNSEDARMDPSPRRKHQGIAKALAESWQ